MIAIYNRLSPETEAHLINSSDWLRLPDTIQLGCYAEHDSETGERHNYVLYAVKQGFPNHPYISFGAHFGENPWDYCSHGFMSADPLSYCGGSKAIMVAIIRYFMLKEAGSL